ncbi:hypothetical protein TIFTF001_004340 [Ficus carica]|uniref:Uncharacterized protein n=1 Tax=Ficus carica TaxID=3494 RepID=A0AA87ZI93_FICCA|nr:hypothetical protein TIFTF001_004340 [Ficus carica]
MPRTEIFPLIDKRAPPLNRLLKVKLLLASTEKVYFAPPRAQLERTFRLRLAEKWDAREFSASRGRRINKLLVELTAPANPGALVRCGGHARKTELMAIERA